MMINYSSVNVDDDDVNTNTKTNIERTKMNVDSYYERVFYDGNNNINENNNNQRKLVVSEGTYLLSNERIPVVVLEEQEDYYYDSSTINKSNSKNNNNNKRYMNYNSTVININTNISTINKKTKEKELQSKKEIRGMMIDTYNKPMDNKKDTEDYHNNDNDDDDEDYDDIYVPQFLIPSSSSNRNYNNYDNSSRNNNNDGPISCQIEHQQHRNNNNNSRLSSSSSSSSSSQRPSFRMRSIYVNAIVLTFVFCIWVVSFIAVVLHPSPQQQQQKQQQQQQQQQVRNQKDQQQKEQIETIPKYHTIHSRLTIDEQIDLFDEWKSQWHRPTTSIGTTTTAQQQQHDHSKTSSSSSSSSSSSMLLSSSSLVRNPSITTTTTTTTTTLTSSGSSTSTIKKEIDTFVHPPPTTFPPSNRSIIYLNTTTAFAMLLSSDDNDILTYSSDYFTITASGWDAQINQAYCGVASTSAVLNSYKDNIWLVHSKTTPTSTTTPTEANTTTTSSTTVPTSVSATATTTSTTIDGIPIDYHLPIDDRYSPYMYATQPVILNGSINECVQQNVVYYNTTYDGVYNVPGGLSLYQVQQLLHCHLQKALPDHATFTVHVQEVNPISITIDTMRQELINALQDPYKRCIINFNRLGIQQYGGGHFSPLGSYNKQYDMFLLLDVAKYKYPPVWVSTVDLYNAMSTIDKCGIWNYPLGQFDTTILPYLNRFDLYYTNQTLLYQLLTNLGCTSTYRGYIITEIIIPQ